MSTTFIRLLCVLTLTFVLAACGNNNQQNNETTPPTPATEAEATQPEVETEAEPSATTAPTEEPEPTETPEPTATPEPKGEAIEFGEPVRGELEAEDEEAIWLFSGAEGDMIYATLETVRGELEPVLQLYDSENELLASSETVNEFRSDLIFTLEADDDYQLIVSSGNGEVGTYELALATTQAEGALEYGDSVTGVLTEDTTEGVWTFSGVAGEFVDIQVTAEDDELDTRIDVYDANDNLVGSDDDTNELNPEIISLPLLIDGDYTIIVSPVGDLREGTYTLELNATEAAGGTIEVDVPVEGELAGGSQLWTFEGEAGQQISIRADATEDSFLDPVIHLYDPNGARIASDDDGGESVNSFIREVTLAESGTYAIVITAVSGEGGFILTLGAAVPPAAAGTIGYDATVEGTLAPSEEQGWTFEGAPGDLITIAVNKADGVEGLDVRVALRSPSGETLISDDDSGEDNNALIEGYPLVTPGTYTIVVSAFSGDGAYNLTLGRIAPSPIAVGDTITGEMPETGWLVWSFDATEGDVVNISATRTDSEPTLDLQLTIISAEGEELLFNDDGAGDLNPILEGFEVPATGTYFIVVTSFRGEGAFELALSAAE